MGVARNRSTEDTIEDAPVASDVDELDSSSSNTSPSVRQAIADLPSRKVGGRDEDTLQIIADVKF